MTLLTTPAEIIVDFGMQSFAEACRMLPEPDDAQARHILDFIGSMVFKHTANATQSVAMAGAAEDEFYRRVQAATAPKEAGKTWAMVDG